MRRSKQARLLTEEAAREQCLRLLARRARSAEELRRRLRMAGFEQNTVEAVLADLERGGLVDDEEFARLWVAERRRSGQAGRHKLRWELQQKGIARDLIRASVDEAIDDEAEVEQALVAARRRLGNRPADAEALLRLRRFLLGRGYGYGTVEAVLRRISAEPLEG
jgi:regulatory protein